MWEDAEKAYIAYSQIGGGGSQSLKRVAERGGFSSGEFAYYFKGLVPETFGKKWPTKKCDNCTGSGEVVLHEDGGLLAKCGICMGAGVIVPDELPPCRKVAQ